MIAMKTTISAIIREYEVSPHYKTVREALDNAKVEISFVDKNHFPVILTPRKQ